MRTASRTTTPGNSVVGVGVRRSSSRTTRRRRRQTRRTSSMSLADDERRAIQRLDDEEQFIKAVNSEGIHVVEFIATWCRKCKTLNAKMEYFAAEHPDFVTFHKVDVNNVPQELVKGQEVTKMPTLKIFVSGRSVYEKVGFDTVREILDELEFRLKQLEEEHANATRPAASK